MTNTAMQVSEEVILNGVNATAIFQTIDAIKDNNNVADFEFRLENKWLGGAVNRSTIKDFYGALENHNHAVGPFSLDNGEPPVLLGEGKAPNPMEYLLHALVGCITTTLAYHAAARSIAIEAISSRVTADLDLQEFLGMTEKPNPGARSIDVSLNVKTVASIEEIQEMIIYSPVMGIVSKGTKVNLTITKI